MFACNQRQSHVVAQQAAPTRQHGEKERDHQVVPQQLLVAVQHHAAHGLQHQQAQQPPAGARAQQGSGTFPATRVKT